ncbi:MAG TPA: NUDIX domain-containing protein [Candidatus Saccharimonadales bacterium]|nr:NUDIX domain-containing protein [Candidatus Saccharimonadales bacterium]
MHKSEDTFHLGVKALIRNGEGKILLLQVNKKQLSKTTEAYWDIPGGRVQRGELPQAALRREVHEETGIDVLENIRPFAMTLSNIRIPQESGDVGLILWAFTCYAPVLETVELSSEHVAHDWFEPVEVMQKLSFKYPLDFLKKLEAIA